MRTPQLTGPSARRVLVLSVFLAAYSLLLAPPTVLAQQDKLAALKESYIGVLRPTDEDAREMERTVLLTEASWQAYRQATLQLAAGRNNAPLFRAYMDIHERGGGKHTIDIYEPAFSTPAFRAKLPPTYTPRQFATWTLAIRYYPMLESMTARLAKSAAVVPRAPVTAHPLTGNVVNDQNYAFIRTHMADIEALTEESQNLMGFEPPPDDD